MCQQKDTLIKKLDSLSIKSDSLKNGVNNNNINPAAYNENTQLDLRTYFILLGNDFKQQLTLPFHTKRKDIVRLAEFGLLVTGAAFIDKPINKYAVKVHNDNKGAGSISNYVTRFGGKYEVYTLAAMASYGFIFKNEKIKTTTFLATQSYLTAGVIETTLKFLTGRQRPSYINPVTGDNAPTFHGPFFQYKKDANEQKPDGSAYSAFPSGHATVAFAAATVFAMEYRNKPIIPIIAYSAATLIGLSRITENKHWPTDVLVGAALGFLSGKQVVNNYHRYAKLKAPLQKKTNTLSFNLHYSNTQLLPGLTYRFN